MVTVMMEGRKELKVHGADVTNYSAQSPRSHTQRIYINSGLVLGMVAGLHHRACYPGLDHFHLHGGCARALPAPGASSPPRLIHGAEFVVQQPPTRKPAVVGQQKLRFAVESMLLQGDASPPTHFRDEARLPQRQEERPVHSQAGCHHQGFHQTGGQRCWMRPGCCGASH